MNTPQRFIYADNAATTPVSSAVLQAMLPYFCEQFGNPSAIYSAGVRAKRAVEQARADIAACLGAQPEEIFFTSGGSESDNWAIKGAARRLAEQGKKHLVTSKFEHHAVLHAMRALEQEGFSITYLQVHENGLVRPEELAAALRPDTALCSVMYANHEIGTIQPIAQLGAICRQRGVLFHTDAVQAVGQVEIDVQEQNIDLLSFTGHKLHGPKGCGGLYIRRGVALQNLIDGGGQEMGRRAGTENTAGIVGLAAAVAAACSNIAAKAEQVSALRNRLIDGLRDLPGVRLNGDLTHRLPGNVNVCFSGIDGEALALMLDLRGICASSGSACTTGSNQPSHVLLALGVPPALARGALRLTLSNQNTQEDVDEILRVLPDIIHQLRSMP